MNTVQHCARLGQVPGRGLSHGVGARWPGLIRLSVGGGGASAGTTRSLPPTWRSGLPTDAGAGAVLEIPYFHPGGELVWAPCLTA